jgi:hypothetical protein
VGSDGIALPSGAVVEHRTARVLILARILRARSGAEPGEEPVEQDVVGSKITRMNSQG